MSYDTMTREQLREELEILHGQFNWWDQAESEQWYQRQLKEIEEQMAALRKTSEEVVRWHAEAHRHKAEVIQHIGEVQAAMEQSTSERSSRDPATRSLKKPLSEVEKLRKNVEKAAAKLPPEMREQFFKLAGLNP